MKHLNWFERREALQQQFDNANWMAGHYQQQAERKGEHVTAADRQFCHTQAALFAAEAKRLKASNPWL